SKCVSFHNSHAFAATRMRRRAFFRSPPFPYRSERAKLVLYRVVQFLLGVHHVLMRLLNRIEFLLLVCRQNRPNLRHRAVDYSLRFLHGLLKNGGDLRSGLIKNGLDLRLLFSSQVQLTAELPKAERVAVCAPESGLSLRSGNDKTAQCDRTGGDNC